MLTQNSHAPIAVFGATGVQGGAVARTLAEAGVPVRALGRDPARLHHLSGNLIEPHRLLEFTDRELDAALEGARAAFVCLPLASGFRERAVLDAAQALCRCLQRSSVQRVVWTASWLTTRAGARVSSFFDSLRDAADLVLSLPQPSVVLSPAGYLDNLLTPDARDGIAQGQLRYMLPERMRYRWVSSGDQGRLVEAILAAPDVESRRYAIGQFATGAELARAAAGGLGRDVSYETVSPEEFAEEWRCQIGPVADLVAQDYMDIAAHTEELGVHEDPYAVTARFDFKYQPLSGWFSDHASLFETGGAK